MLPIALFILAAMPAPIHAQAVRHSSAAPAAPVAPAPQPTPIGNPADWITPDSYPVEAKAAGREGRTGFALDVDAQGRITGCRVVESSGTPILDQTACQLMILNGRFRAARGADGNPVASEYRSAMRWTLTEGGAPEDEEIPVK